MNTSIEFHDIVIKFPELQVTFRGRQLHVSLAQLRLLMIFLSGPYLTFTSYELITKLQLTNKPALATLINSVRALLDQQYIVTVWGEGYAFADRGMPSENRNASLRECRHERYV